MDDFIIILLNAFYGFISHKMICEFLLMSENAIVGMMFASHSERKYASYVIS